MLRIAVVAALCCFGTGTVSRFQQNATERHYQELNSNLSKYQDAWKSNTENAEYVLAYRTFQDIERTRIRRCVSATLRYKNKKNRTTVHRLRYYNTRDRKWEGHSVLTRFNATPGYTVPNLMLMSSYHNESDEGRLYWTLYSQYGSCNIVRVERNGGCELWVRKGLQDYISSCCWFIYKSYCGNENYQIYNTTYCKRKGPE
uniref:Lipocalin n=1 Tax=Ixodes ricinus TaxID=34613 RepID=B7ZDG7_IXORI|nr:lipocalin [Ixodes ricinus]